jgi:hypothetical protein
MEPFPLQYSCHPRPDEATDPNIRLMLEEFQRIDARFIELHNMEVRMGDKIDGHLWCARAACGGAFGVAGVVLF